MFMFSLKELSLSNRYLGIYNIKSLQYDVWDLL